MEYIAREREEIIKELLDNRKVKAGQFINYAQFLELYEPYKEVMNEQHFAEILGISYDNYRSIKTNGMKKTEILKERKTKISEEEKENIIEELLGARKVKAGQFINYAQFLELYEPYKETLNEEDFAKMLGISCGNYRNIKYKRNEESENIKRKKNKNKRRRKRKYNRRVA